MRLTVTPLGAVVRVLMGIAGGYMAYQVAPDIEQVLFPMFRDEYLVPFDTLRPDTLVERQLDRVCWKLHFHKVRTIRTYRRTITIIAPDGSRYFEGPIDGRTGDPYSNKDSRPYDWNGDVATCAYIPNSLDATESFKIESYGQYVPVHGLWMLEHTAPIIDVPPVVGDAPQ